MFWRTYGSVIGWMFVVGVVAAAVLLLVVFAWLVPPDRGEESAIVLMPFYGGFLGAVTATAANVAYGVGLVVWTRRAGRSVASQAWVGAVAAGAGAFGFWALFGYAVSGMPGLPVWSGVGGASAVLALLIAGPLTARAARRASTGSHAPDAAVASAVAIRRAGAGDTAAICAFGQTHIRPHYAPLIGSAAAARQVSEWWNPQVIARAALAGAIVIAESRGQLVGVAQVSGESDPPTIYKFYVHPAWRGHGVGPVLLDAVVRSLPAESSRIAVEHFAANERAGAFYAREGFVVDHVSQDASGDPALAIVWRVKNLS